MESTTSQDPAVLAVQVQSLAAMVEELTRQNQEMRQQLQQEQNQIDNNGNDGVDSNGRCASMSEETNSDLLQEMRKEMNEFQECHQGEDRPEFGQDSQEDGFTIHRGRLGVSRALQISFTSTGTFQRAERPTGPPEYVQDNIGPSTAP